MKQITESDFIDLKSLRDENINRVEVLDRVGTLAMMPGNEYATTKQIADFYQVETNTINSIILRNSEELSVDGFKTYKKAEVIELLNVHDEHLEIPNRGLRLCSKRAVLRIGMLLRDSEVARQVRTYLLDVEQIAQEVAPGVISMAVGVMDAERELKANLADAILNGDIIAVTELMGKIKHFEEDVSARRIVELTEENKALIADNENLMSQYEVLKESEMQSVKKLNFIMSEGYSIDKRKEIVMSILDEFADLYWDGKRGECYRSFYLKLNERFNIDVYSRPASKKGTAYIHRIKPEEMPIVEEYARMLVLKYDIDIDKIS